MISIQEVNRVIQNQQISKIIINSSISINLSDEAFDQMKNSSNYINNQQSSPNQNNQLLFSSFENLISTVINQIPPNAADRVIPQTQIYSLLSNGFNNQTSNDIPFKVYARSVQQYLSNQSLQECHHKRSSYKNFIGNFLFFFKTKFLNHFGKRGEDQRYQRSIQQKIRSKSDSRAGNYGQHTQTILTQPFENDKTNSVPLLKAQQTSKTSYEQPHFYQKNMTIHFYNIITPNHLQLIAKDPYIAKSTQVLNYLFQSLTSLQSNSQFKQIQLSVANQISECLRAFTSNYVGLDSLYYEKQSWIIVLVYMYKYFQTNYDSFRRRILKKICRNLQIEVFKVFKNYQNCVRWLENTRPELQKLESVEDFVSKAHAMIFDVHKDRSKFLKGNIKDELPVFQLVNLSRLNLERKKVVNIWISGFLSQDMDKQSHWIELTGLLKNKQIYAVQWQSNNIKELVKFIGKSCIEILTADKMKEELKKKFKQNPFIPAMQTANMLGRYLAEMLVRLFPVQFINITGYSLGTQMIKSCVQRLIEVGRQSMLCSVYMLGGVTDCTQLQNIVKMARYPINIHNCYTGNDLVLKDVLSLCIPQAKPIGLNPMNILTGHQIINTDCSSDISGHLSYMSKYDVIGTMLGMDKD